MREIFSLKLHKGLGQPLPGRCLPLDFLGIYALAGLEPDKNLKNAVRKMMILDITKRRDCAKNLTMVSSSRCFFLV